MRLHTLIAKSKALGLKVKEETNYVVIFNKRIGIEIYHDDGVFYKANRADVHPSIALNIRSAKQCAAILGIK